MKVLQTLGVYGGTQQAGIFQYCRNADGVTIDPTIGRAADVERFYISHEEWADLLRSLREYNAVFDLGTLRGVVADQLRLNTSEASCIVAILEHEGSFDHYGGLAGRGAAVTINLRRDY